MGANHTIELFKALRTYGYLHERQSNYKEAISYFEDAYICVSEAYGPVHHRVQEAAGYLTDSLLQSKEYIRAEIYARINYESLVSALNGIYSYIFYVFMHKYILICIYTYLFILYIYIYINIYVYIYIYIHVYTYTHLHTLKFMRELIMSVMLAL
jgi:hypothetical protein